MSHLAPRSTPHPVFRHLVASLLAILLPVTPVLALNPSVPPIADSAATADVDETLLDLTQPEDIEELARLKFNDEVILWATPASSIGMVHVYTKKGRLYTIDLMKAATIGDPIDIPGLARNAVMTLPATNILLAFGTRTDRRLRAFDVFTGNELWATDAVPPPDDLHPFYDAGMVVLEGASEKENHVLLTGLDVQRGEIAWTKDVQKRKIASGDRTIRLLGCPTTAIDVRSGRVLWQVDVGEGNTRPSQCELLHDDRHVLVLDKHLLEMWSLPVPDEPPPARDTPLILSANREWSRYTKAKYPQFSSAGKNLLTIVDPRYQEIRRVDTGELLTRTRARYPYNALHIAPDGKWGAVIQRKKLLVYRLDKEDLPVPLVPEFVIALPALKKMSATDTVTFDWEENEHLLISRFHFQTHRLVAADLISLPTHTRLASIVPPPPPKYSLTAAEKRRAWGRGLLSLAAIAVGTYTARQSAQSLSDPNNNNSQVALATYQLGIQTAALGIIGMISTIADTAALKRMHKLEALQGAEEAYRRYEQRLAALGRDHEHYFVTGKVPHLRIVAINFKTGEQRLVGTYDCRKVHAFQFDTAYGLTYSLENNNRDFVIAYVPRARRLPKDSPILRDILRRNDAR